MRERLLYNKEVEKVAGYLAATNKCSAPASNPHAPLMKGPTKKRIKENQ
jgi:hypothetical protein